MKQRIVFYSLIIVIIISAATVIYGVIVKSLECFVIGTIVGYIAMVVISRKDTK